MSNDQIIAKLDEISTLLDKIDSRISNGTRSNRFLKYYPLTAVDSKITVEYDNFYLAAVTANGDLYGPSPSSNIDLDSGLTDTANAKRLEWLVSKHLGKRQYNHTAYGTPDFGIINLIDDSDFTRKGRRRFDEMTVIDTSAAIVGVLLICKYDNYE